MSSMETLDDYDTKETLDDYADTPDTSYVPDVPAAPQNTKNINESSSGLIWYIVGALMIVLVIVGLAWYTGYLSFLNPYLGSPGSSGVPTVIKTDPVDLYANPDFSVLLKEKATWGPNVEPAMTNSIVAGGAPTIIGWQSIGTAKSFDECRAKVNNTPSAAMDSAVYFGASGKCLGRSI